MNKKDVEHIGYILSKSRCFDEILYELSKLDSRIGDEYELFEEVAGRCEEVDMLVEKLMVERYGHKWPLLREKPPYGEVLEEVRRKVYGDGYHSSLFK
jgi:hypothetical protein